MDSGNNRQPHVSTPETVEMPDKRTTIHNLDPCNYTPEYAPFVAKGSKRKYPADFKKRMDKDGDEGMGGDFEPGTGDMKGKSSLGRM